MNTERLQELIDLARLTSPQRWRLGFIAVCGSTVAAVGAGFAVAPFLVVMVTVPSVVAAVRTGSMTPFAVMFIVIAEWLGSAHDIAGPASLVVATGLFVFHAALALMAATPHSTSVASSVLRGWVQRSVVVAFATASTWGLVRMIEGTEPPGSRLLVLGAFAVVVAGTWAARARSIVTATHTER